MTSLIDRTRPRPTRSRRPDGRTAAPDPDQTRTLLTVAFRPSGMAVLLISAVIVVTLVSASSDLTGAFGAIATTWLAIHQVPATIDGVQLGVLPLFPTAVMMWVVARRCASAATLADTRADTLRLLGAAVAGPLTVTAISLVVVADASAAIPLSSPNTLSALGWVAGIHLVAAGCGVTSAHWRHLELGIPSWLSAAVRPAAAVTAALSAAGSIVVLSALLVSWTTVGDLLSRGGGFVGVLGLTVLSLLYLPNLVFGAVAVLTGAHADIGEVSISVFGNVGGELPPLPLLGAVPEGVGGGFWAVLLVIPVGIGVWLGRDCARRVGGQDALLTVVASSFAAGTVMAVLALASGGDLGYFGALTLPWVVVGVATFGWLALFGAISVLVTTWLQHRKFAADERLATGGPAATRMDRAEAVPPEDEDPENEDPADQNTGDEDAEDAPESVGSDGAVTEQDSAEDSEEDSGQDLDGQDLGEESGEKAVTDLPSTEKDPRD